MEFVKLEDIKDIIKAIDENLDSMTGNDVYESLVLWLESVKKYHTKEKPYMPIRIRDYGYTGGKYHEYDCGVDLNHHWLQIDNETGDLSFVHMQCGAGSCTEEVAKEANECCFIPTFETDSGYGFIEKYITPETMTVLVEGEEDE